MAENEITRLIVIGGSAGSLEIIFNTLPFLENENTPPIIIVIHRKGDGEALTNLLQSKTNLLVKEADDKDILKNNCIYIAPSDYHLLAEQDRTLSLDYSEKVNYSRPSIDVTFQTAAEAYGKSVLAILLSGASADGTLGMKAIKEAGGIVAIQDPSTAEIAYMPQHALEEITPDYIFDGRGTSILAELIKKIVGR